MNIQIDVKNASKTYHSERGEVEAIRDFSMEVAEGDFVAIVGPSGCGKTTLLWGLTGLHPFSGGSAKILGDEVGKPRQDVGIIFQQANLLPWRTLIDNIHFPLEIMGEDVTQYEQRVHDLLQTVGLVGFEDNMPNELSGGMQQRASIVRALSVDPKVLLMDEPFGALDAYTRDEMDALLLSIWNKTKKTIAFVTHRIEEAVYLADRVYVMTPRPAVNAKTFTIDLPRPRPEGTMMTQDFFNIVATIKQSISDEVKKQKQSGEYQTEKYSTAF
ncbi:MAG: ABC transporter ATP-binding protein [Spirochaetales bacterium]|nr:ABC transporter ATP-binding protein [Spirochaetales bacterium]MCF7938428.1 ABC transporter ATP-binding protein [Spirochaetales bacterium]